MRRHHWDCQVKEKGEKKKNIILLSSLSFYAPIEAEFRSAPKPSHGNSESYCGSRSACMPFLPLFCWHTFFFFYFAYFSLIAFAFV